MIAKSTRGLLSPLLPSVSLLVHTEGHLYSGKTPVSERQHNCRSGITIDKGSLRLNAKTPHFQSNVTADGALADRLVCILTDKATAELLQLETGPEK